MLAVEHRDKHAGETVRHDAFSLDDTSEVKTSSVSHFLSFYEKHTDPILSTANV